MLFSFFHDGTDKLDPCESRDDVTFTFKCKFKVCPFESHKTHMMFTFSNKILQYSYNRIGRYIRVSSIDKAKKSGVV